MWNLEKLRKEKQVVQEFLENKFCNFRRDTVYWDNMK